MTTYSTSLKAITQQNSKCCFGRSTARRTKDSDSNKSVVANIKFTQSSVQQSKSLTIQLSKEFKFWQVNQTTQLMSTGTFSPQPNTKATLSCLSVVRHWMCASKNAQREHPLFSTHTTHLRKIKFGLSDLFDYLRSIIIHKLSIYNYKLPKIKTKA